MIYRWPGPVEFDHPVALCHRLADGDLDVALVSSLEYLRHPVYRIVDRVSIAARGPVYSVIIAHERQNQSFDRIETDPASETSVALLRCLLANRKQPAAFLETANDVLAPLRPGRARLLIGDQAIRFRNKFPKAYQYWDLAEEWNRITQLPFVFAFWLIRPEVTDAKNLAIALRQLRDRNLGNMDELIAAQAEVSPEFCRKYYREHLSFDFAENEKAGLQEFHRQCVVEQINVAPELDLNLV